MQEKRRRDSPPDGSQGQGHPPKKPALGPNSDSVTDIAEAIARIIEERKPDNKQTSASGILPHGPSEDQAGEHFANRLYDMHKARIRLLQMPTDDTNNNALGLLPGVSKYAKQQRSSYNFFKRQEQNEGHAYKLLEENYNVTRDDYENLREEFEALKLNGFRPDNIKARFKDRSDPNKYDDLIADLKSTLRRISKIRVDNKVAAILEKAHPEGGPPQVSHFDLLLVR